MRINLTASKVAAIGELYRKNPDGMAIMDLIVSIESENRIAKSIKQMKQRLLDTQNYTHDIVHKLQATPQEMDVLRDYTPMEVE